MKPRYLCHFVTDSANVHGKSQSINLGNFSTHHSRAKGRRDKFLNTYYMCSLLLQTLWDTIQNHLVHVEIRLSSAFLWISSQGRSIKIKYILKKYHSRLLFGLASFSSSSRGANNVGYLGTEWSLTFHKVTYSVSDCPLCEWMMLTPPQWTVR